MLNFGLYLPHGFRPNVVRVLALEHEHDGRITGGDCDDCWLMHDRAPQGTGEVARVTLGGALKQLDFAPMRALESSR